MIQFLKICIHVHVITIYLNSHCKMKCMFIPKNKYFSAHGANVTICLIK